MTSERRFLGISSLLFLACALLTARWCGSMTGTGGMSMPGGWTMSMTWMRMPAESWMGAGASFLGMWMVMMVAMMWPSFVPALLRYRRSVTAAGHARKDARLAGLTVRVGIGYFTVWAVIGALVFPLGTAIATVAMRYAAVARLAPIATGGVILLAGALQFTACKKHHLACCLEAPRRGRAVPADPGLAWRHGLRLGLHCAYCCAGLTAVLLAIGVMDLRAMTLVAALISVERLAPAGGRVPRGIGAVLIAAGILLIAGAGQVMLTPGG